MQNKEKSDYLTDIQKEAILIMFFGPYIPEWRDKKGRVDNRDKVIAKRIGVNTQQVTNFLDNELQRIKTNIINNITKTTIDANGKSIDYIYLTLESKMNKR